MSTAPPCTQATAALGTCYSTSGVFFNRHLHYPPIIQVSQYVLRHALSKEPLLDTSTTATHSAVCLPGKAAWHQSPPKRCCHVKAHITAMQQLPTPGPRLLATAADVNSRSTLAEKQADTPYPCMQGCAGDAPHTSPGPSSRPCKHTDKSDAAAIHTPGPRLLAVVLLYVTGPHTRPGPSSSPPTSPTPGSIMPSCCCCRKSTSIASSSSSSSSP
jgi:hypothetical protein